MSKTKTAEALIVWAVMTLETKAGPEETMAETRATASAAAAATEATASETAEM